MLHFSVILRIFLKFNCPATEAGIYNETEQSAGNLSPVLLSCFPLLCPPSPEGPAWAGVQLCPTHCPSPCSVSHSPTWNKNHPHFPLSASTGQFVTAQRSRVGSCRNRCVLHRCLEAGGWMRCSQHKSARSQLSEDEHSVCSCTGSGKPWSPEKHVRKQVHPCGADTFLTVLALALCPALMAAD